MNLQVLIFKVCYGVLTLVLLNDFLDEEDTPNMTDNHVNKFNFDDIQFCS